MRCGAVLHARFPGEGGRKARMGCPDSRAGRAGSVWGGLPLGRIRVIPWRRRDPPPPRKKAAGPGVYGDRGGRGGRPWRRRRGAGVCAPQICGARPPGAAHVCAARGVRLRTTAMQRRGCVCAPQACPVQREVAGGAPQPCGAGRAPAHHRHAQAQPKPTSPAAPPGHGATRAMGQDGHAPRRPHHTASVVALGHSRASHPDGNHLAAATGTPVRGAGRARGGRPLRTSTGHRGVGLSARIRPTPSPGPRQCPAVAARGNGCRDAFDRINQRRCA